MQGGVHDILPIVELKPFFKKVWRREKSLPEFYLKLQPPIIEDSVAIKRPQNLSRENNAGNGDSKGLHLPCATNPSHLESRLNVDTSLRNRTKIHPSTQFSYNCRPQKSPHFIPGFITRAERTKTTLQDAHKWEDKPDCLKQTFTSEVHGGQQQMRVHGGKLNKNISIKQLIYLNPKTGYSQHRPIDGYHSNPESPFRKANVAYGLYGEDKDKCYGSPPLSEGEPSRATLWSRRHLKSSLKHMNFDRNMDTSSKQPGQLYVGGIKNAFQILSNRGKPTNVERKLTFEMELNLQQCRRHANNGKFHTDLLTSAHHLNTISSQDNDMLATLTRGEVMLLHGREANRRKRQASGLTLSQEYVDFDRNVREMAAVQMELVDIPMGKMEKIEDSFQSVTFENPDRKSASGMSNSGQSTTHPISTTDTTDPEQDDDADKENRGSGSGRSVNDIIRGDAEGTPTSSLILPEIRPKMSSECESSQNDKQSNISVATHSEASIINDQPTERNIAKSTQTESKSKSPASKNSVTTRKSSFTKSPYPRDRKGRSYNNFNVESTAFVTSP